MVKIFEITDTELSAVERFADALWGKLGVDVRFTRHFLDRVNDERNGKPISAAELIRLFKKEYAYHGRNISKLDDVEAVMKDLLTNINVPFIYKDNPKGNDELVAKTIMRKADFKTPNPEFIVDDVYNRHAAEQSLGSILKNAGYKKLGAGVDATVWTKDGQHVVKIIMPDRDDLDGAAAMFHDFYYFCKSRHDNPFLPKFIKFVNSEIERFEEDGVHYIMVGMEKLQKLNQRAPSTAFYWLLSDLVTKMDWSGVYKSLTSDKFWHDFMSTIHGSMPGDENPEEVAYNYWMQLEQNPQQLSVMQAFYDTMRDCYKYGNNLGYSWDLHTENIMRRGRTPVIVDPWTNF